MSKMDIQEKIETEKIETPPEEATPQEVITWDEAEIHASGWVRLETDIEKKIQLKNWKLIRKEDKFTGEPRIFFTSEVNEEDGIEVEKIFENGSTRLRLKLKGLLKDLDPTQPVVVSIIRTGEKMQTQYVVKKL